MKIAKQIWTFSAHFCYTTTPGSFPNLGIIIDFTDGSWIDIIKTENFGERYGITIGEFKFKSI